MPWRTTADLPESVQGLPQEAKAVFLRVANEQLGKGRDEASAMRIAWTAVKNGWEKQGDSWVRKEDEFTTGGEIAKVDDERRVVWGWASVYEEAGKAVVDLQGDVIHEDDILDAAHDFVTSSRKSLAMHQGNPVGTIVESLVFTLDIQKALGISLGKSGWLIGVHIHDEEVWKQVKSGRFRAFSIGGVGIREEVLDG